MLVSARLLSRAAILAGITLGAAFAPTMTTTAAASPLHLRLVKSEPAKGDTVASPASLRLWFSEPAMLAVTSVKLKGADDTEVPLGKPTFSGNVATPVEVAVTRTLAAGTYIVSFKTASQDMHPITGDYSFVVR